MILATPGSPHLKPARSVTQVMLQVCYALIPGLLAYLFIFGGGILSNLLLAVTFALLLEAGMLWLRGRPIKPFVSDGSALVTGVLLALALPTLVPWWITFIGVFFAIVVAKHLYGGLGHNPFNPAMVGYVVLLISFPVEMTTWPPALSVTADAGPQSLGFIETLTYQLFGQLPPHLSVDAITAATPLDYTKTQLASGYTIEEIKQTGQAYGLLGGTGWDWLNLWFLVGGIWLIYQRIISWHIPVALIGTLFLLSLIIGVGSDSESVSPLFHLFSGATMLGAFFIATDPVSSPSSHQGKLLFGIGIGILVYSIRTWGGYPDAIAFSVLLMNMVVPVLDYYTQPRVYGQKPHKRHSKGESE